MYLIKRIHNFCRDPYGKLAMLLNGRFCKKIKNDKIYIRLDYLFHMHKRLHLRNPKTYNEKLQWLKLYYRNPIMTDMVDKAVAKSVVNRIMASDEYVIPTIGIYDKFEDIDFDALPNSFVIKTTHDSGGIVVVRDKSKLDIEDAKNKINASLKNNFYLFHREWPYKNVKPRIIIEKYMVDESGTELKDYKFFCFYGEPRFFYIASERTTDTKFDFFDLDFNHLDFENGHSNSAKKFIKPENFEKMVEIARKLSQDLPHVRIDLYNINGKIFFGEFTFFHWGGIIPFKPEIWDSKIGDMLTLPPKWRSKISI